MGIELHPGRFVDRVEVLTWPLVDQLAYELYHQRVGREVGKDYTPGDQVARQDARRAIDLVSQVVVDVVDELRARYPESVFPADATRSIDSIAGTAARLTCDNVRARVLRRLWGS